MITLEWRVRGGDLMRFDKTENGAQAGDGDELYFTAGPEEETHGLFGEIAAGEESED